MDDQHFSYITKLEKRGKKTLPRGVHDVRYHSQSCLLYGMSNQDDIKVSVSLPIQIYNNIHQNPWTTSAATYNMMYSCL